MKRIIITYLFLAATVTAHAGHRHPEKWYQDQWCFEHGGQTEIVMENRTRCDCITSDYAVEFDFAEKWAKAVGQSLNYGTQTGLCAGVLIVETSDDYRYVSILRRVIQKYELPITLWVLDFAQ